MRGKKSMSVLLSFAMVASACLPGLSVSAEEGARAGQEDRIVYYNFQEYDSTIVNDASGNGKAGVVRNYDAGGFQVVDANIYGTDVKALALPGGADGGYLELPVGILEGCDSVTISTWVKLLTNTGYQRIWDFGSNTSSYMYLLSDGGNDGFKGYSAAITQTGWSNEVGVSKGTNVAKNRWVLTTVVMDGTQMTLYENGEKIGTKDTGISVADLGSTTKNYIGYGQFGDDPTNAQYAEFTIYNYAMTDDQVAAMYDVDDAGMVAGDLAALELGDLSAVIQDLELPTAGENGSEISWASSDEAVISSTGKVTRPQAGEEDAQVTLTATVAYQSASDTKEFQVTVPALLDEAVIVERDLEAIELVDTDRVVSDLILPTVGENGSEISWTSSNEAVIANDGKVTRPGVGEEDAQVTLTATASYGSASADRSFEMTVLAKEEAVTITGYEPMNVTTQVGYVPSLPNYVKVTYSNGTTGKIRTVWETPSSDQYGTVGTFEAKGTILGTQERIKAEVTVVEELDSELVLEAEGFDLNDITLDGDSILTQNRDRTLAYLKLLDNDRMLYNFRRTFGQDTKGASPLGGWDEPTGLLRGHSTGHYLSALSLAYASTKDQEIKDKLDEMVHELRELQKMSKGDPAAFTTQGTSQSVWNTNPEEWGEGFLSAYSPDQFALLEVYTPYATIWAPYYTLHKIISGFLDAYTYTGNEEALEAAKALGKWVYLRLSACSQEQLTRMWDMYIAGEFGGFNESMAKLYELTGDEDYLKGAKLFDNTKFFDNLSKNIDDIEGRHANQHIPQIVGALEIYQATVKAGAEETYYYDVAKNFWDMVVSRYAYSIGGVGTGENFKEPYKQAEYINGDRNCETCAAYNMLKLTKMLYQYDADNAEYMDYYERTLYNQIIASQNPNVTANMHNGTTYMLPIGPGVKKSYGGDYNSFTCCHGTGMENHVKYQEAAYYKTDDTLYVNLYLPSTLTWEEKGVQVAQETQFPSETTKLTVSALDDGAAAFDMKLRVPYWAENGFSVTVNGETVIDSAEPSSYVVLADIQAGDVIEITTPYGYHLDKTPDKLSGATVASVMYGPFVMVAKLDSTKWKTLVLSENLSQSIKTVEGEDVLTLTTNGLTFKPMYDASNYAYHTYFKVVIGDGDSAYYEASVTNATPDRGTFELSSELVKEGDTLVITAIPNEGYKVKRLTVNGENVQIGEDNTYTIENVDKEIVITGSFALLNPPAPDNTAIEQIATVSAHYTADWENLEGIKNQRFNPTVSNGGTGRGWGDWPQSSGTIAWVEYEWDAPVTINGSKIFWYDDGGGTRVPSEISFQYEDEDGNVKDVQLTSNVEDAKKINVYNDFTFETFQATRLRINMKIASNASATGIYRWIVTYEEEENDMVDLASWIAFMEELNGEEYTAESWAVLQDAITAAKAIEADETATRAEIDGAIADLVAAFGGLEYGVQKQHLQIAVEAAEAILSAAGDYDAESLEALKSVIEEAKAVLANSEATQEEVNVSTAALIDAIVQVAKDADLVSLESLVEAVEKLDGSKYTEESMAALTAAVEEAKAVLANPDRGENDLANAYTNLADAIRGLEMKGNKAALSAVIAKAEEILADASQYVESSISGLEGELEAAKVVYDNENATQAQVSSATEKLTRELVKARLKGDVDRSGRVDTKDTAVLLKYTAEMTSLDAEQLEGADVNGDGKVDTKDAVLILQYASEKITAF